MATNRSCRCNWERSATYGDCANHDGSCAYNTLVAPIPTAGSTVAGDLAQVIAQFGEKLDTHQSSLKVVDVGGQPVSVGNGQVDLDEPDHKAMLAQLHLLWLTASISCAGILCSPRVMLTTALFNLRLVQTPPRLHCAPG